jgi:hypothetical protein
MPATAITARIQARIAAGMDAHSAVVHTVIEAGKADAADYAAECGIRVRKSWTLARIAEAVAAS